jgi:S-adenosylmethionine/arginine decarboxylase-like enzyme
MIKKSFLITCLLFSTACMTGVSEDYKKVQEEFEKRDAWGLYTHIDLRDCDPELIRSKEAITQYVHELCDLIEMKRFRDTQVVNFGEEERVAGYSMVQLIETSCISGHFANATNAVYIDIFSCKLYDPEIVRKFTADFFKGTINGSNVIFRK